MTINSIEIAIRKIFIFQNVINAFQYALNFSKIDEFIIYTTVF